MASSSSPSDESEAAASGQAAKGRDAKPTKQVDLTPLIVALVLLLIMAMGVWHRVRVEDRLVRSSALEEAAHLSDTLKTVRQVYNREVVQTASSLGVVVTHDYQDEEHAGKAIPLPVTLTSLIAAQMDVADAGAQASIYSGAPFPWREGEWAERDAFSKEAWRRLSENPEHPFTRFEERDGRGWLRYATADVMQASCVDCHNQHPDSPKTDWQEGEVRGVLEVTVPLENLTTLARESFRESLGFTAALGVLAFLTLVLVFTRLRRASSELEAEVNRRTVALAESEARIRAIFNAAADGIITIDQKGRIRDANPAACVLFGYERYELIGEEVKRLMPEPDRSRHDGYLQNYLESGVPKIIGSGRQVEGLRKDGSTFPMDLAVGEAVTDDRRLFTGIIRDISERVQLEARFRLALEAAPNAMIMVNEAGEILLVNQQAETLFGYDRSDLLGQSVHMLVPDSVRPHHPELFASFFADPKVRSMGAGRDLLGKTKDGREIPLEIGLNPIETDEGTLVMASIVDISERVQLEARFRLALEAAPNAMVMVNEAGEILLVNQQAETLFGYDRSDLLGESVHMLVPDAVRPRHPELFASFFNDPKVRSMGAGRELTARHKSGREIPVEIGLNPIETDQGTLVMASIVDITERLQSEARFRLAIEAAPNAMVMVNETGVILLVNRQLELLFGYARNELLGEPVHLLVPNSVRPRHPDLLASFFANPQARRMGMGRDLAGQTKDGREIPIEIGLNPIELDGQTLVIASIVDISERLDREQKLAAYSEELELQNQELGQFAYVVSHDLKAPLRSIMSLAQWTMEDYKDVLDEEGRENLDLLISRTRRMDYLVDGILEYSRVGRQNMQVEIFDSGRIVREVIEDLDAPEGINIWAVGRLPQLIFNPVQFRQVIQNLVGNAVKHMGQDEGEIVVACEDQGSVWSFSVKDNGPGIAEEHFERIFRVFQTLRSRDEMESTGIGLSIVKKIVERAGGRVSVASTLGEGTTFTFTIPKGTTNEPERTDPAGGR